MRISISFDMVSFQKVKPENSTAVINNTPEEHYLEISPSDGVQTRYLILAFVWIEYLWTLYLNFRQYHLCKETTDIPENVKDTMTKRDFDKARLHILHKLKYSFIRGTASTLVSTIVIKTGLLAKIWTFSESLWKREWLISCTWILIMVFLWTLVDLPFRTYNVFVIEKKCGFTKETLKSFLREELKIFVLSEAFGLFVAPMSVTVVKYGGRLFVVWLWVTEIITLFILYIIYPSYIAPLTATYTPLPAGPLRSEIEVLASQQEFALDQIFLVERRKRVPKNNIYFSGLFGEKHLIIFETLFTKPETGGCSNDEVLAILAHELGHWKRGHTIKLLIMDQADFLLDMLCFAFLLRYSSIYMAIGFQEDVKPILVGLLIITQYIMMPYNAMVLCVFRYIMRNFELGADAYAGENGKAKSLQGALIQLNKNNLEFPIYDFLYFTWHHSRPPLIQRLEALQKYID